MSQFRPRLIHLNFISQDLTFRSSSPAKCSRGDVALRSLSLFGVCVVNLGVVCDKRSCRSDSLVAPSCDRTTDGSFTFDNLLPLPAAAYQRPASGQALSTSSLHNKYVIKCLEQCKDFSDCLQLLQRRFHELVSQRSSASRFRQLHHGSPGLFGRTQPSGHTLRGLSFPCRFCT